MIKSYRDLTIWQKAMDLSVEIYRVTRDFPVSERYNLASQLKRASISIPANIAEGRTRTGRGEFRRSVSIARGSIAELETELELARRLGYVSNETHSRLAVAVEEVGRMASGLLKKLKDLPKP
jgi:four helix bundle protein